MSHGVDVLRMALALTEATDDLPDRVTTVTDSLADWVQGRELDQSNDGETATDDSDEIAAAPDQGSIAADNAENAAAPGQHEPPEPIAATVTKPPTAIPQTTRFSFSIRIPSNEAFSI